MDKGRGRRKDEGGLENLESWRKKEKVNDWQKEEDKEEMTDVVERVMGEDWIGKGRTSEKTACSWRRERERRIRATDRWKNLEIR